MSGTQGVWCRRAWWTAALAVLAAAPVSGQGPFLVEVRGGAHQPLGDTRTIGVADASPLERGPSLGVAFGLQRGEHGYLLLGFSQHRSGCIADDCPSRVTTQWELGWRQDLGTGPVVPFLRAGLVVPRVERVTTQDSLATSGTGYGAEAGVGLRVHLGGRVHLAPGVRSGWGRVPVDGLPDGRLPLRWVVGDLTLVLTF